MPDYADHATENEQRERETLEASFRAEQERKRRIAESLRGYDPSKPVNCVDCGEDVPPARLEQYPHTRRCTACASEVERRGWT